MRQEDRDNETYEIQKNQNNLGWVNQSPKVSIKRGSFKNVDDGFDENNLILKPRYKGICDDKFWINPNQKNSKDN